MKKIASICILSILLVGSTSTNMTKKHLKQMKNLLNRLVITTLLAISGSISYAQYVPIPDYNFNVFLQTNYPMCMNNFQLDTTCPQITNATSLILSNLIISNLEGVQYFDSLKILRCSEIQLQQLPNLPSKLEQLWCWKNQLTSLPDLPFSLKQLLCGENQLPVLPTLPITLEKLQCYNNQLTQLPLLPDSLILLSCHDNFLTALPQLPQNLEELLCYDNNISNLPNLPTNLTFLDCAQNALTSLPNLPPYLEFLKCANNQISTLPQIPNSVTNLYCGINSLTSLPELPDSLYYCELIANPLTCLPQLKKIGYLRFPMTAIQCIPNYGNVLSSNPPLNNFPLCDLYNLQGCNFYYNISGQVFSDNNLNCIKETTENGVFGQKINVFQSGNLVQQSYTTQTGLYSIDTDLGAFTYTVDTMDVPYNVNCPTGTYHNTILTVSDSMDYGMDFGIKCKSNFDIGIVSMNLGSNPFFPGDTTILSIKGGDISKLYNLNCASGIGGTVVVNFSGPVTFGGHPVGSLSPNITQNSLTYNIADFGNLNLVGNFKFFLITDTIAQAGQPICINVTCMTGTPGDLNLGNNQLTHCFSVVNSFDPNNKEVNPKSDINQGQEWLYYTINFQNTGNAPSQHVTIIDTLDSNLNESTFTFLDSNHEPITQVTGRVIKFNFPNINLPDSTTDEPNSHGYVQYKVKIDQGLNIGQTIQNTAAIYFDFNAPIITNTTSTLIVAPTAVASPSAIVWSVFPVPASESFMIMHPELQLVHLTITDITGKEVMQIPGYRPGEPVNVVDWADGVYLIKINSGNTNETLKFIKAE